MSGALIVDSDPQATAELRAALEARGYDVVHTTGIAAAVLAVGSTEPQVIVVGELAALVALRTLTTAPIIVLCGGHRQADEVTVLDAGADDHVATPFDVDELLARVRAAVRRAANATPHARRGIVDTGSFTVDLDARKVWRDGAQVRLSPTEWRMLETLIRREGALVTKRELLHAVWGLDDDAGSHYLRVYMGHLRRKLEPDPARPRHLITEQSRGYRFHARRVHTPRDSQASTKYRNHR